MAILKWTKGNSKLKKTGTIGFGLPAFRSSGGFKTCPMAGACAAVCYARQGAYTWPSTIAAREYNLRIARSSTFAESAISDLSKMRNVKTVRIHDSGDFFSQAYFDAWTRIAQAFPGILFYAYTKSLHLDMSQAPSNLKITQSMGGILDKKINPAKSHARIFSSDAARIAAGYLDGNSSDGDGPAMRGEIRIGLVYHGTKNLTENQVAAFS